MAYSRKSSAAALAGHRRPERILAACSVNRRLSVSANRCPPDPARCEDAPGCASGGADRVEELAHLELEPVAFVGERLRRRQDLRRRRPGLGGVAADAG